MLRAIGEGIGAMRLDDLRGPECVWCGKELDPSSNQMLYCCDAHNKAYQHDQERRARLAEKASWNRRCPACDAPIPVEARRDRIYCSKKCFRVVDEVRSRGARRLAARANRTCEHCGATFTLSTSTARHRSKPMPAGRMGEEEAVPMRGSGIISQFVPIASPNAISAETSVDACR
jgi:hypothetical protein